MASIVTNSCHISGHFGGLDPGLGLAENHHQDLTHNVRRPQRWSQCKHVLQTLGLRRLQRRPGFAKQPRRLLDSVLMFDFGEFPLPAPELLLPRSSRTRPIGPGRVPVTALGGLRATPDHGLRQDR